MNLLHDLLEPIGLVHPAAYATLLLAGSLLILWRVEALLDRGFEGTALGTLVLPYCSGLGNLVFVFLVLRDDGPTQDVIINSLVNNVTNLTLLLGVPALLGRMIVVARSPGRPARAPKGRRSRGGAVGEQLEQRLSRLSLLLSLAAVGFFTGALWLLGADGELSRSDGAVLIGLFLFWQTFQVFDTLKHNLRRNVSLGAGLVVDVLVILGGAWLLYESLDWLVQWLAASDSGFFRAQHLGWITGWLLVLPNALLAGFFAFRGRADVVYASQVGDGHICIPLCVGLAALVKPIAVPAMLEVGAWLLLGAMTVHLACLAVVGRLPRLVGGGLIAAYGWFVYSGLAN